MLISEIPAGHFNGFNCLVTALRMNVTLRELFLADNRLVSTDALQIANLLKFNTVLQLLDIRNNLIQVNSFIL